MDTDPSPQNNADDSTEMTDAEREAQERRAKGLEKRAI